MRRFVLLVSVAAIAAAGLSLPRIGSVSAAGAIHAPTAKKVCKTVKKKVHGKTTKKRVCHTVTAVTPTPTPVPALFSSPTGVAVDAQGNVYVADNASRIQELSPSGQVLADYGTLGTGPGQFNHPNGIALDAHGDIFVADTGNSRIQELSSTGQPVAQWGSTGTAPGQFTTPASVAVDGAGNVYVADYGNGRIQRLAAGTQAFVPWGALPAHSNPVGVAVDSQGSVYVCDQLGTITKESAAGTMLATYTLPGSQLTGIAVNNQGAIDVVDFNTSSIIQLSSTGQKVGSVGSRGAGSGQFDFPAVVELNGLAFDANDNLYVADAGNSRIESFSPTGQVLAVWK